MNGHSTQFLIWAQTSVKSGMGDDKTTRKPGLIGEMRVFIAHVVPVSRFLDLRHDMLPTLSLELLHFSLALVESCCIVKVVLSAVCRRQARGSQPMSKRLR